MNQELKSRLEQLAWKISIPFCYGCYKKAPSGVCQTCFSDDLMRLVEGVGCEYGIEWVIEHLVRENVQSLDTETAFEESIAECYPETVKIGWIEHDTISAIKALDPISWDLAKSEWIDSEDQDEQIVTFDNGSTYYWVNDVESYVDEAESTAGKGAA